MPTLDELKPNADQRYLLVRRELPPDRRVRVFSADLERALAAPTSPDNFELAPRDRIYVFDLESGRDRIIEPLMRELRMQSRLDEPTAEVTSRARSRCQANIRSSPACASATCCAPAAVSMRPRTAARPSLRATKSWTASRAGRS